MLLFTWAAFHQTNASTLPKNAAVGGHARERRSDHGRRRAAAQPEERHDLAAARQARRLHGAERLGKVVARVRHDLRRRPAPLRRVALAPTRGSSSSSSPSPTSSASTASRPRSRSSSARSRSRRARPSAPSPRSPTTCACSSRASAFRTARTAASASKRRRCSRSSIASSRLAEGARFSVLAPICRARKGELKLELERLRREGFVRARIDGTVVDLGDEIELDRTEAARPRRRRRSHRRSRTASRAASPTASSSRSSSARAACSSTGRRRASRSG